ncbi:hypothetical protein niasHT_031166 [Heterodera trifolii]|uniref:Mannose-P-dolichol utilization defect 1 protein homolog n=1 Tax=Heterodera trifolii TaxID=157864 RepID=A0ABD2IIV8_9BILA
MVMQTQLFRRFFDYLFPGKCSDIFFVDFNFFHKDCAPILVSRLIGIAITLGSSFLLVPQILKIHSAKSGEGISLSAQLLGLVSAAAVAAYSYEKGFVFGQWGDSLFVALQTMVIVVQMLHFAGHLSAALVFVSFCWSISMAIFYHHIPMAVLTPAQAAVVPIVFLSKGIQIVANYQNASTGQLSLISVSMQFGGCVARVFTSVQETAGDWLVIAPFVLSSLLNGLIFLQILFYAKKKKTE